MIIFHENLLVTPRFAVWRAADYTSRPGYLHWPIYLLTWLKTNSELYILAFRPSFFYFLIYEKIFKMLESGGRNKNKNTQK